jgi:hypothetical protein
MATGISQPKTRGSFHHPTAKPYGTPTNRKPPRTSPHDRDLTGYSTYSHRHSPKLLELSTTYRIAQTPNQPPDYVYPAPDGPIDWDTPTQHLPLHVRNAQIQYRDRALYKTAETHYAEYLRSNAIQNVLRDFRQLKQRNPHASDFPHYRSTDLAQTLLVLATNLSTYPPSSTSPFASPPLVLRLPLQTHSS